jgi:formylglycine-generating enzyme required for sulfatase activity
MSVSQRQTAVCALADKLPAGFVFHRIVTHQLGESRHDIAEFMFDGATFVLIPGGTVTLGYDATRAWEPTAEEERSWADTAESYGLDWSIREQIKRATLRPRVVRLQPFLMETGAQEVGWDPIAADDPQVRAIVKQHFGGREGIRPGQVEVFSGASTTRVTFSRDGTFSAQRPREGLTYQGLSAELARNGFRFPTPDEWEYACGAGAATLFRWGDHAPCDRYPIDSRPPKKLSSGFPADWDLHTRPNALGVRIAFDPYHMELTTDPKIVRGGDGGGNICGGAGFFVGWPTLATAYFEEEVSAAQETISPGYTFARRVLPIASLGDSL